MTQYWVEPVRTGSVEVLFEAPLQPLGKLGDPLSVFLHDVEFGLQLQVLGLLHVPLQGPECIGLLLGEAADQRIPDA